MIILRCGWEEVQTSSLTRTLASTSLLDEQRWDLPTIAECPAEVLHPPDASTTTAPSGSGTVHGLAASSTGPSTEPAFNRLGLSARATFASPAVASAGSQDVVDTGTSADRQVLATQLSLGLGGSPAL